MCGCPADSSLTGSCLRGAGHSGEFRERQSAQEGGRGWRWGREESPPGLHSGEAGSGKGGEDDLLGSKMDQAGSICFLRDKATNFWPVFNVLSPSTTNEQGHAGLGIWNVSNLEQAQLQLSQTGEKNRYERVKCIKYLVLFVTLCCRQAWVPSLPSVCPTSDLGGCGSHKGARGGPGGDGGSVSCCASVCKVPFGWAEANPSGQLGRWSSF